MAKGFKDPQGRFRPTENKNGVRKSRDKTAKTQGVRLARTTQAIAIEDLPIKKSIFIRNKEDYYDFRSLVLGGWFLPLFKKFPKEQSDTVERLAKKYDFRPVPISFLEDYERIKDGRFVYGATVYFRGSGEGMDNDSNWHKRNTNEMQSDD